jgi:hypothetical protein
MALTLFQLITCITKFIENELGSKYVTPPTFDIAKSYDDSNCLCPLIFILSPGADPMAALMIFANKMGYSRNFRSISLGQGQVRVKKSCNLVSFFSSHFHRCKYAYSNALTEIF